VHQGSRVTCRDGAGLWHARGSTLGTSYGVNLAGQQEDHRQFIERLCVMGLRD
jgi:hypothetical protein